MQFGDICDWKKIKKWKTHKKLSKNEKWNADATDGYDLSG